MRESGKDARARFARASVVLALSLSYLSYVFGIFRQTFWTAGLGDWIDPYFINYLLEHWFHALVTFSVDDTQELLDDYVGSLRRWNFNHAS